RVCTPSRSLTGALARQTIDRGRCPPTLASLRPTPIPAHDFPTRKRHMPFPSAMKLFPALALAAALLSARTAAAEDGSKTADASQIDKRLTESVTYLASDD